jgi:hypothetical protein
MGLRRPEFRLTSGVRRLGGRQSVGGPHDILTITDDGAGHMKVITAAPHGLGGGEILTFAGTSNAAYVGAHAADQIDSAVQFTSFDPYLGDSTGGTWS